MVFDDRRLSTCVAIFQSSQLLGGQVSFICKIAAKLPFVN